MRLTHRKALRSQSAAAVVAPTLSPTLGVEIAEAWRAAVASPFWLAVTASIVIHLCVLTLLSPDGEAPSRGRGGVENYGVGVELISSAALESLSKKSSAAAETSGTDVTNTPDQMALVAQPLAPTPEPAPSAVEVPPRPGIAELAPPAPAEPERVATPEVAQAPSLATATSAAYEPSVQTGAAAANASPGDMTQFEIEVRDALGRNRPAFPGATGHVEVVFGLSAFGDLHSVSISRSSGNDRLDRIVLRAVKATRFPLPPSGTTDLQRSFSVPFDFQRVQIARNKTRRG